MRKLILYLSLVVSLPAFAQTWTHMGPFNQPGSLFITGRANVVRPDPAYNGTSNQTIYLGSVMGGFWKTTDDGSNWTNIPADQAVVKYGGVSALAITPNGATVYVADISFQYGSSGVYKYTGGTWTATGTLPGTTDLGLTVHNIQIHPADPLLVFAATTSGLYRSTNGGTSWTKVINNNIKNVNFVPSASGTSGSYAYIVLASGTNEFSKSTDDGSTFTMVSGMTALWSSFNSVFAHTSYTPGVASGDHFIYLFGQVKSGSPITVDYGSSNTTCYGVYRYSYNENTLAESSQKVILYTSGSEDYQTDRLTVTAHQNIVYFGGTGIWKYNLNTAALYNPGSGTDFTIGSIGYTSGIMHPDLHDAMILPSLNKILLVTDGGFYMNNYTPGALDVFTNSWSMRNNGLHISQVLSFSGSEDDPELFSNSDVDNASLFINDASGTFRTPSSLEAPAVLIDKYNSQNIWYRSSAYTSDVKFSDDLGITSTNYNLWVTPPATGFCDPGTTYPFGTHEFSLNSLFQDVNRPGHVYYNTNEMGEFCFSDQTFRWKLRPGLIFYPTIDWGQNIVGMAFSRQDKNDVWLSVNRGSTQSAQILQFTGPDIDDSWIAHNENQWTIITPDWSLIPHGTVTPQLIWYPAVAASDWAPNTMWAICSVWPSLPATDMPVKVLMYLNGIWSDMSAGIPVDESPTSLVYEQGSNDHLYLGTNRSVYYYDPAVGSWVDISQGQSPHIMTSQMQINYTENTLRLGMKGRGVWKHDLICPAGPLTLSGGYTGDQFHEATTILASAYKQTSDDVKMRGSERIDFVPGGTYTEIVASGSNTLLAFIHACASPGNTWRQTVATEEEPSLKDLPFMEKKSDFMLYPNPTSGSFTLTKENDEVIDIEIFDFTGRSVFSQKNLAGETFTFDISDQSSGVYLVRIISGTEVKTIRLIKD